MKGIHVVLAEKKEPEEAGQKFMMIYRSMVHSSTRKESGELLNRRICLKTSCSDLCFNITGAYEGEGEGKEE